MWLHSSNGRWSSRARVSTTPIATLDLRPSASQLVVSHKTRSYQCCLCVDCLASGFFSNWKTAHEVIFPKLSEIRRERKVRTHSLQFCAVPKRGNCCWGCRDDAKMMQDNGALFVYFLYLSAFLPTLCHLALFCPEFVHHRFFGSSPHRICASSESLHQTHIKWCILWICASSPHRSAEPGIVPARSSI